MKTNRFALFAAVGGLLLASPAEAEERGPAQPRERAEEAQRPGHSSGSSDATRSGTAISEGGQEQPFGALPEESLPDTATPDPNPSPRGDPDIRRIEAALNNDPELRKIAPTITVMPNGLSILISGDVQNTAQRKRIIALARAHTDRPVEDLLQVVAE